MSGHSDNDWLKRLRDESSRSDAFSEMVTRYGERLYWHIRKTVVVHEDADDVLQNTFLKAWKGVGTFKGDVQPYTWLYRIATNESINFLNRKRSMQMMPPEDIEYLLSQSLHYDSYFSGDELQMQLQQAILTLPEKQRIVFNMRYFDETPYDEMSEILGTSVGALKATYHHAVNKIKEWFKSIEIQ